MSGFSGEQYALPEAVEQLAQVRKAPRTGERVAVNATDPLNLVGTIVPGATVPAIRTRDRHLRRRVADRQRHRQRHRGARPRAQARAPRRSTGRTDCRAVTGPLNGVRVVDLTTMLSGPVASALLADQGADVIKIEGPTRADLLRFVSPQRAGFTEMYLLANRGKRSLVVDLQRAEGIAVLQRLVATADVVMQNFRPGVAARMGLGYDDLRSERDDLVYLSISGFGETGPLADLKVYDNLIQSASGMAYDQGRDGDPTFISNFACDKITALTAAQAVTAALFARATGRGGQHITVAMLDAAIAFLWTDACQGSVLLGDDVAGHVSRPTVGPWRHRDGWTSSTPATDAEFRGFCIALGHPEAADDPRFATQVGRMGSPDYLILQEQVLRPAAADLTVAEMLRRLTAHSISAVAVVPLSELHEHDQVRANHVLHEVVHPTAGAMHQARSAAEFGGTPSVLAGPAPAFGEHTDAILADLGYDESTVAAWRADGTVA